MRALHQLVQSLSKEEKRLYTVHGRQSNIRKIYQNYLKMEEFSRTTDKQIYEEDFSNFSKAYYSLLKRDLLDDVLAVLLEYSNQDNPDYKFIRLYSKTRLLVLRGHGEAVEMYIEELTTLAEELNVPEFQLLIAHLQRELVLFNPKMTLERWEKIVTEEDKSKATLSQINPISRIEIAFKLLQNNPEGNEPEVIRSQAQSYHNQLKTIISQSKDSEQLFDCTELELLYLQITRQYEVLHQRALSLYKEWEKHSLSDIHRIRALSWLMQASLRVGDFLQLQGLIYKISRELSQLDAETLPYLNEYREIAALYYFYENELTAATKELEAILSQPKLSSSSLQRILIYYAVVTLTASLPNLAEQAIQRFRQEFPETHLHWLLAIFEVLIKIDQNTSKEKITKMVDTIQVRLKQVDNQKNTRSYRASIKLIGLFLDKKNLPVTKPISVLPEDWEPIIRVDLWILAKKKNKFYHELISQTWQQRKKVY
ncbi:MAG: hypothetical protein LC115_09025 [Bacteroidia bacterium]|nr:hypothetical protein [Bacteroidia bacterium]